MSQKDKLIAHIDALYSFALFMVKNENDAEDLVQETYLKAFKSLQSINADEIIHEKAWLFKILMNTFINQYWNDKQEPTLIEFDSIDAFHKSIEEDAFDSPITEDETRFEELLDTDVKMRLRHYLTIFGW